MAQRSVNAVRPALVALLAASFLLVGMVAARAEVRQRVIRIYDTTGTASDIRAPAIRTAASILIDAGVAVEWRDCTEISTRPACQDPRLRQDLILRIMPVAARGSVMGGRALELRGARGQTRLPLGVAMVDPLTLSGQMATVFHEQVRSVARLGSVDSSELLGRAFAHEIGHLLLRSGGHSESGLMRAVWSVEELALNRREDWVFAPADRQRLRESLSRPLVGDDAAFLEGRHDLQ